MRSVLLLLATCVLSAAATLRGTANPDAPAHASLTPDNPIELGDVHWGRNLDEALGLSAKRDKPTLILFQEVPGCANCTRFGQQTLSHPLIVEAIETLFVPVAIYNNAGGADAAALRRYGEPAWNNPVVRIVDAAGADLVPRMPDFRSPAQVTSGMIAALEGSGHEVPAYLRLVDEELRAEAGGTATATFETACFWSGEGFFGEQPDVVGTEAGWQDGAEVVRVAYVVPTGDGDDGAAPVFAKAARRGYRLVDNGDFAPDREPKYYLLKSRYAGLPLTGLQAARVNALIGQRRSPDALLSPRQLALLEGK